MRPRATARDNQAEPARLGVERAHALDIEVDIECACLANERAAADEPFRLVDPSPLDQHAHEPDFLEECG